MRVRHYKMEHTVPYSLSNRSAAASRRAADDGEQQAPAEWGDKPVAREKRQYYDTYARADVTQSIINLTTCVLGAGALGYPFCFKECGLALATIIMFVTLVATRVSYQLLLYCAQLSCRRTYEGIAEQALGKAGRQLLEVCIAALSLGALVAFLDILADVLSAVAGTIIPPGAEPSRHAYITGVTLAGALPVCLVVRDHALIAAMSNASVLFVVIFALAVFFSAFAPYVTALVGTAADATVAVAVGGNPAAIASQMAASSLGPPVLHMWHLQGALVSLPVMAYGFTAHQYYMGIYTMLKAPSVRKMKLVTDMALVICAGVYWTIGVGGYATFGERTAGDLIRNLGGQRSLGLFGAYERALKLCYGMAILGNIPLMILPFYSILRPLLPDDNQLLPDSCTSASLAASCAPVAGKPAGYASNGSRSSSGGGSVDGFSQQQRWQSTTSSSSKGSKASSFDDAFSGRADEGEDLGSVLEHQSFLQPPLWHQNSTCSAQQQQQPGQQQHPGQQQQQQQQLDPHLTTPQASYVLTASQHALVVVMVLGVGLACALWLPNVELIFGLTGSTASVLVAFIIPALCFIKLYHAAPELGGALDCGTGAWGWIDLLCCCGGISSLLQQLHGSSFMPPVSSLLGGGSGGSNGSSGFTQYSSQAAKGQVLVVPELRAQWLCRRRLAVGLLVFGIISGLLCTDAILGSISEEKAVVQLAQELAAHEAVVAETNRAQQKAKEAQAAVEAVNSAAQQLSTVSNTNSTLGTLAAAAAALSTISNASSHGADGSGSHPVWDLKSRLEERKQKAAEDSVLRNVEAALAAAQADIMATFGSVTQVVIKLDSSILQIKADAAAAAASATAGYTPHQQQQHPPPAQAVQQQQLALVAAPDGTVLPMANVAGGSSQIIPHREQPVRPGGPPQGSGAAAGDGQGGGTSGVDTSGAALVLLSPAEVAAAAPSTPGSSSSGRTGGGSSSSSSNEVAFERVNEMAHELSQALGVFGQSAAGANLTATAGKSLEQVRDSALSALTALNITSNVLSQVKSAVVAARRTQKRDSQIKELVVSAMQRALNATAASALAMTITGDALSAAANEESSELLLALRRVATDLDKAGSSKGRKASITVTMEPPANTTDTVGSKQQEADSKQAAAATAAAGAAKAIPEAAGAGAEAAQQQQQQQQEQQEQPAIERQVVDQQQLKGLGSKTGIDPAAAAALNAAAHAGTAQTADNLATSTISAAAVAAAAAAGTSGPGLSSHTTDKASLHHSAFSSSASSAGTQAAGSSAVHSSSASSSSASSGAFPAESPAPTTASDHGGTAPPEGLAGKAGAGAGERPSAGSSTQGRSGDGSDQNTATSGKPASAADSSSKSADVAGAAAALSNQEAVKVRAVIEHLASALSGTAGGIVSRSSAGGGSNSSAAPAAKIAQLAAAIQDAMVWTEVSKTAVLKLIQDDLGQTNPKIANRVVDIVREVSTDSAAKEAAAAAAAEQDELQQPHQPQHEQAKGQQLPQQLPLPLQQPSAQERPAQQQGKEPTHSHVAGPAVIVAAHGSLQQQAQGVEGPVVKLQSLAD